MTEKIATSDDIGFELAHDAFQLLGSSHFEVSATLDIEKPKSLEDFKQFKELLCRYP